MNAVNQTANCVKTTTGQSLSAQIRALIGQGLSNPDIADLTGAKAAYVRAVRSRYVCHDHGVRRRRMNSPGRASRRQKWPAQTRAELRVLAHKLYELRQEGLL